MKRSLKIVFAVTCVAVFCYGQTATTSTAETAPPVNAPPATPAPAGPTVEAPGAPVPTPAAAQATGPAPQGAPPTPDSAKQTPDSAKQAPDTAKQAAAKGAGTQKPYIIGPLDVLLIKVWNNPNLSQPVDVGADGMISMPLIGEVKADGLTKEQLKDVLTERLRTGDFMINPVVDVTIGKINSKKYYVYGGVGRAGEYPLIGATTVMDALASVNGFRDFANTKKIYVLRTSPDGTAKKFYFNYKDVSRGKNMEQNIQLENGDRIIVPD